MAEETIEEQKPEEEGVEIELDAPEESKEVVQEPAPEPEIKIEVEEQPEEVAASEEPKDEVDEYGVKVQARIKKLTEKYRKEERDREEPLVPAPWTFTINASAVLGAPRHPNRSPPDASRSGVAPCFITFSVQTPTFLTQISIEAKFEKKRKTLLDASVQKIVVFVIDDVRGRSSKFDSWV